MDLGKLSPPSNCTTSSRTTFIPVRPSSSSDPRPKRRPGRSEPLCPGSEDMKKELEDLEEKARNVSCCLVCFAPRACPAVWS